MNIIIQEQFELLFNIYKSRNDLKMDMGAFVGTILLNMTAMFIENDLDRGEVSRPHGMRNKLVELVHLIDNRTKYPDDFPEKLIELELSNPDDSDWSNGLERL